MLGPRSARASAATAPRASWSGPICSSPPSSPSGAAIHAALRRERRAAAPAVRAPRSGSPSASSRRCTSPARCRLGDALVLVRERGLGMQEASEARPSGLTALRCETDVAEAICAAAREQTGGVCSVANLNAPGQVVISGDLASLDAAEAIAKERGHPPRRRACPWRAPSTASLMEPGRRAPRARPSKRVEVRTPARSRHQQRDGAGHHGPGRDPRQPRGAGHEPGTLRGLRRRPRAPWASTATLEVAPGRGPLGAGAAHRRRTIETHSADAAEALDGARRPARGRRRRMNAVDPGRLRASSPAGRAASAARS